MISLDNSRNHEWDFELKTRDIKAIRQANLPVDYKFARVPRGNSTNQQRRRKNQAPILGARHRRVKKIR